MRVQEEDGTAMDDPMPTDATDTNAASVSNTLDTDFGDQTNWMPLPEHPQNPAMGNGPEVQRTLQGLTIGSIPQRPTTYGDGTSYGTGGSSNDADTGLSPATTNSNSNRPTPNASTPSDSLPKSNNSQNKSGGTSYETSPEASISQQLPATDGRAFSSFFSGQPDYTNTMPATGLTPDNSFNMPDTPGRGFDVPNGWDLPNQITTGLTPVGEGVFRQLLGLGPMDAM